MPPIRANSIVTCSCGARWGDHHRASLHEDLAEVEHVLLEMKVPIMVRHHALGHRFTLGENAPPEFLATIARAAARAAGDGWEAGVAPAPRGLLGAGERGLEFLSLGAHAVDLAVKKLPHEP